MYNVYDLWQLAGLERMTTGSVVSALPYRATQVISQIAICNPMSTANKNYRLVLDANYDCNINVHVYTFIADFWSILK